MRSPRLEHLLNTGFRVSSYRKLEVGPSASAPLEELTLGELLRTSPCPSLGQGLRGQSQGQEGRIQKRKWKQAPLAPDLLRKLIDKDNMAKISRRESLEPGEINGNQDEDEVILVKEEVKVEVNPTPRYYSYNFIMGNGMRNKGMYLQAGSPANIRPYHCPVPNCSRSYKNPNGLKYHAMYGHCPPRCFLCHKCTKRYTTRHGLLAHLKLHSKRSAGQSDGNSSPHHQRERDDSETESETETRNSGDQEEDSDDEEPEVKVKINPYQFYNSGSDSPIPALPNISAFDPEIRQGGTLSKSALDELSFSAEVMSSFEEEVYQKGQYFDLNVPDIYSNEEEIEGIIIRQEDLSGPEGAQKAKVSYEQLVDRMNNYMNRWLEMGTELVEDTGPSSTAPTSPKMARIKIIPTLQRSDMEKEMEDLDTDLGMDLRSDLELRLEYDTQSRKRYILKDLSRKKSWTLAGIPEKCPPIEQILDLSVVPPKKCPPLEQLLDSGYRVGCCGKKERLPLESITLTELLKSSPTIGEGTEARVQKRKWKQAPPTPGSNFGRRRTAGGGGGGRRKIQKLGRKSAPRQENGDDEDEEWVENGEDSEDNQSQVYYSYDFIMGNGMRNKDMYLQAGSPANIRPYHCPVPKCSRSYKNPNGLKYHAMYGHCPPRCFPCHKCSKKYTTRLGLTTHLKQHSPKYAKQQKQTPSGSDRTLRSSPRTQPSTPIANTNNAVVEVIEVFDDIQENAEVMNFNPSSTPIQATVETGCPENLTPRPGSSPINFDFVLDVSLLADEILEESNDVDNFFIGDPLGSPAMPTFGLNTPKKVFPDGEHAFQFSTPDNKIIQSLEPDSPSAPVDPNEGLSASQIYFRDRGGPSRFMYFSPVSSSTSSSINTPKARGQM